MKQTQLTWQDVEQQVQDLCQQLHKDQWHPEYIVGLTRGGLIPATMISHYTGVPLNTLNVSLRDGKGEAESNLWMAEDAFGYEKDPVNILIVDDINDTGDTLNWIRNDWQSSCMPKDPKWNTGIWGKNVRIAVLYDNLASKSVTSVSYSAVQVNKRERPEWIVFPWESWWKN